VQKKLTLLPEYCTVLNIFRATNREEEIVKQKRLELFILALQRNLWVCDVDIQVQPPLLCMPIKNQYGVPGFAGFELFYIKRRGSL
jgi:hypothetical protein